MTVDGLIALDLLAEVTAAAAWFGAAAAAAARRSGTALAVLAVAVAASLARAGLTAALASGGEWFVQEKVTLTLPLLLAAGLVALLVAVPRLLSAVRGGPGPSPAVPASLFFAGYAAAAGPAVTLLAGYPATWSIAVFTIGLVAAAALFTWRVLSASVSGGHGAPPGRAGTVAGAAALIVGLLGIGLAFVPGETSDTGGGPPEGGHMSGGDATMHHATGTPVTALRGPSGPTGGGTVRRYTLTARTATVRLASGRQVAAWTFDGRVPGPPITATRGDLVEVRLRNADITAGVTLHWHGYDVPSGEDGVPGLTQEAVMPGQEFVYRFRAEQAGTYWYHTHEVSDQGVRMGLYGTLLVTPPKTNGPPTGTTNHPGTTSRTTSHTTAETAGRGTTGTTGAAPGAAGAVAPGVDLTLPVHTFSGVLALGDQDGPYERRVAPGAAVRLRLINTDNTPHRFALTGTSYRVASIDGRDLNDPGELSRVALRLPAGSRYDLVFPMPSTPVALLADDGADTLRLTPDASATPPPGDSPGGSTPAPAGSPVSPTDSAGGSTPPAIGSRGPGGTRDTSGWPEFDPLRYGTPAATPFGARSHFDRSFTMVLDRGLALSGGRPMYAHTVNGRAFPSIPTQLVREGDLVRVTVVNRGRETHPWHLHGHTVLVLSRDGRAPTGSPLWLDTFDVRPGEVWEVAFRAGNPGMWMNHCHNLGHADLGMALHLAYEGVTTPFHGAHGG
ncbi:multicopper oxidase family protein [Sphaerisporangium fuscum]|uniref:multicopper oxidase family protein n=1 Tax=Sphaerisporangium fuscum TaxID=2835868 RepID=UPI001BDC152F|nr:multicopper oxidase family protein [Sphaerisporangium fuscum]